LNHQTQALQQRNLPHPIHQNIWMWSIFSQEKGFYFNGYAVPTNQGLVIIDPPSANDEVYEKLTNLGWPALIVITNRDHERESQAFRTRFNIPVAAPAADASLLEHTPDRTFQDGDLLAGELWAIHLLHQKSPGESALYMASQRVLFLGDALIGNPPGMLNMLPDEKYADLAKAREGLQRLAKFDQPVNAILPGDGEPVLQEASAILSAFFLQSPA
jgi:glyoxylase-like metal-dependent hydrolase (beta-lactamase superfamily II)